MERVKEFMDAHLRFVEVNNILTSCMFRIMFIAFFIYNLWKMLAAAFSDKTRVENIQFHVCIQHKGYL